MFDFWKEVIINDVNDIVETKDGLRIGNVIYKPKNIVKNGGDKGVVYKTPCVKGTSAVITVPTIGEATRVRIELGLSAGQSAEFAAPYFASKKTVVVDAANTEGIVKALGIALEGLVNVNETGKTITFKDKKVCVDSVHTATIDSVTKDWGDESEAKNWVTTKNVVPVGTGEWILENLRYPTSVNSSYVGPNADEVVDPKAEYTQYAFEYAVPKRGFHGQGAVGQAVTSVTHHIFYVKGDADTKFTNLDIKTLDVTDSAVTWKPAEA
jgi:hypothetical protein